MPRKRMAQGSYYFFPPQTPKLSQKNLSEVQISEEKEPTSSNLQSNKIRLLTDITTKHSEKKQDAISLPEEKTSNFKTTDKNLSEVQTSEEKEPTSSNLQSSKMKLLTDITTKHSEKKQDAASLPEEKTSKFEATDKILSEVQTSEEKEPTSSNLQSSNMRLLTDITTKHLEKKQDATSLPEEKTSNFEAIDKNLSEVQTSERKATTSNVDITNLSVDQVSEFNVKGNGQKKSSCITQHFVTTSVPETLSITNEIVEESSGMNENEKIVSTLEEPEVWKYDNDINMEGSKQQERMQNLDMTTDLVVEDPKVEIFKKNPKKYDKLRKSSSEYDICLNGTEEHENLSDSEKVQKTLPPTKLVSSKEKINENCDLSMHVDARDMNEEKQELALASDIEAKTSSLIENSVSSNRSDNLYIKNNTPSHIPGEDNVIKPLLEECIQLVEKQDVLPCAEIKTNYDKEQPCPIVDIEFSQDTSEAKDSSLENVSTTGENTLSVNISSNDEGISQLINEVLENVIEKETCSDPDILLPFSTSDMASNHNDVKVSEDVLSGNTFTLVSSPDEKVFDLINEELDNVASLTKTQTQNDSRTVFPCSASGLEYNPDSAEEERSSPAKVFTPNSTIPVNSSDSDESLIKTPENAVSLAETTPCYEAQTSTHFSSDMGSVHSTTEENKDSLSPDISTYVNSPSVDSSKNGDKLSELINDTLQNLIFRTETHSKIVSPNLTTDLESANDTAGEKDTSLAVVSTPVEKPNDDNTILLEEFTNTDSSLSSEERNFIRKKKSVSAGNEGICRDIEEEVIKGIENHCTEKQLNENITSDKMPDDSLKTVSGVKKDLTSMNGSDEKYEPKYDENMFAKDNKINCGEHRSQVYEIISDGEKEEEKVREEEFQELLLYRPLDFFDRPEIPEDVFILRSDCPCYLKKLEQTFDDEKGFRSEFAAYCSEQGNRIAQESKMKDLAEELKDKMRQKPTTNLALKWANEKENIMSWSGFDFEF